MLTYKDTYAKLAKLTSMLTQEAHLLIVMQDNPDPDAIASAVALRKLANYIASAKCSIAHGGTIGRGENRALVRYLDLNCLHMADIDPARFDLIATVDTQPGTGNNSLPDDITPDIAIDHHPIRPKTRLVDFHDIRRNYGATSTILTEYLFCAGIVPEMPLATALLYGIRSDTQDLGRETTKADIEALESLYPLANKRMLSEIQRGSVQREYWRILAEALKHATIYGDTVIAELGATDNPDMIGEVADLLLRDENIYCTICFGLYADKLLLSVRTEPGARRADRIARSLVARKGTAGGHDTYAGGQISVAEMTKEQVNRLKNVLIHRVLCAVNADPDTGTKLIP